MGKVGVVIAAAGSGLRCGLVPEKQFQLVLGRPLLAFTIEAFLQEASVSAVVVVVSGARMAGAEWIRAEAGGDERIHFVAGADARHRSIRAAVHRLQYLGFEREDVVVVQDGVRPFCSPEHIRALIEAAPVHGAVGTSTGLVSTVLRTGPEAAPGLATVAESLHRDAFRASEMPQAFAFQVFLDMYNRATPQELASGTECLALARTHCNFHPVLLPGDPNECWKVTHRKDLHLAAVLIKERNLLCGTLIVGDRVLNSLSDALSPAFASFCVERGLPSPSAAGAQSVLVLNPSSSGLRDLEAWVAASSGFRGDFLCLLYHGSSLRAAAGEVRGLVEAARARGSVVTSLVVEAVGPGLQRQLAALIRNRDLDTSGIHATAY